MANKVRVTALFLVLAILIATFGAVSMVQAKTVGAVEKLEILEEVSRRTAPCVGTGSRAPMGIRFINL